MEVKESKNVDLDLHQRKFKLIPKYRSTVDALTDYLRKVSPTDRAADADHSNDGENEDEGMEYSDENTNDVVWRQRRRRRAGL
jgi:antitoxin component of MazEF toxin-antitoxin module